MDLGIKSKEEIEASIINRIRNSGSNITDFNVGSVARTIVSAFSAELDDAYYKLEDVAAQTMQATAEGDDLDTIASGFNVSRSGATPSIGAVTFGKNTPIASPITIAPGTIVSTSPYSSSKVIRVATISEVTLPSMASSVNAIVQSIEQGKENNVKAGTINYIESALPLIDTVINANDLYNGNDEELDTDFRERLIDVQTSNLKGTKVGIEADARLVNNITNAYLSDNDPSIGYAKLYVASSGGTPSIEDINNVQAIIENESKAPGTILSYYGAVTVATDVTATVYYDKNYNPTDVKTDSEQSVIDFLTVKDLGSDVYISEIVSEIMKVPGVLNVYDVEINAVASDLSISVSEVSRPGTITVTVV